MSAVKRQVWEANSLWSTGDSEWKLDATTWLNLEDILLSAKSQTFKDKYCMILLI